MLKCSTRQKDWMWEAHKTVAPKDATSIKYNYEPNDGICKCEQQWGMVRNVASGHLVGRWGGGSGLRSRGCRLSRGRRWEQGIRAERKSRITVGRETEPTPTQTLRNDNGEIVYTWGNRSASIPIQISESGSKNCFIHLLAKNCSIGRNFDILTTKSEYLIFLHQRVTICRYFMGVFIWAINDNCNSSLWWRDRVIH